MAWSNLGETQHRSHRSIVTGLAVVAFIRAQSTKTAYLLENLGVNHKFPLSSGRKNT